MKDLLTRIIWKIQQLATTKLFELFIWVTVAGELTFLISNYVTRQHIADIYISNVFIIIFVYYSCYKIILE